MLSRRHKYEVIRQQVLLLTLQETVQNLPELAGYLRLTTINADALQSWKNWPEAEDVQRQIGWDWHEVRSRYRRNHPASIELAIWFDESLCGLMIGKASRGKLVVKINYLQGLPIDHPLKGVILPIAARCAEHFAAAIEAKWVAIQDPMEEPGLLDYYRDLGFDQTDPFDHLNNALFKLVED
ncbi:MAG: hypothetical protein KKF22_19180 [Gammaproteobacteria bacterium]|nr:hypothetical protein [Gammaproteobacteria bacterium]